MRGRGSFGTLSRTVSTMLTWSEYRSLKNYSFIVNCTVESCKITTTVINTDALWKLSNTQLMNSKATVSVTGRFANASAASDQYCMFANVYEVDSPTSNVCGLILQFTITD